MREVDALHADGRLPHAAAAASPIITPFPSECHAGSYSSWLANSLGGGGWEAHKRAERRGSAVKSRNARSGTRMSTEPEWWAEPETSTGQEAAAASEPTGPRETWPVAYLPDGEDILGNGCVLKRVIKKGIASPGLPPVGANCKTHYTAYMVGGKRWDSSIGKYDFFHFIIGDLYVNRCLEAVASTMQWGEVAEFYCTAD